MYKFKSVFLGAAMAATTATAVTFAPSSASAITLNGSLTFTPDSVNVGPANQQPVTTTLQWLGTKGDGKKGAVTDVKGDFAALVPALLGKRFNIENLLLSRLTGTNTSNQATYSFNLTNGKNAATVPFIDFGLFALNGKPAQNLAFYINPTNVAQGTGIVTRSRGLGGSVTEVTLEGFTGVFRYGNDTIAEGTFSASNLGTQGSYVILQTTPVPEPLTMGGLAIGAGFGAYLKKRYSQKEKQAQNA